MTRDERDRFDALVEEAIEDLPEGVRALLDEVPVVVEDQPGPELLESLRKESGPDSADEDLCGLHTGVAFTERSVERSGELPAEIMLFRRGIVLSAGGWDGADGDDRVYEEIAVTLLHEIGHQFGLDEGDLERLGYE